MTLARVNFYRYTMNEALAED